MTGEKRPALLLLPNLLGEVRHHEPFLPQSVDKAVASLDGLIAESETAGRRYLKRFKTEKLPQEIPIAQFNEHTPADQIDFLLEPVVKGERWGLVSDGGLPCVADPGSTLVKRARQLGLNVQAFVGPSSIMMALMLSGLPGQRFAFQGYLDKEPEGRKAQIRNLEAAAKKEGITQIFIEAPYRNQYLLEALVETLSDETELCVAWDITLQTQGILSQPVKHWKKSPLPTLDKRVAIFLFSAEKGL
jgi:16S rRNA (cytidine1402-2'-O)-methyltransferase